MICFCDSITQMLAKLLHIGKPPDKNSQFFHPLVFNVNLRYPFLPELFSRTMWLLSKTRREMKASRREDYPKASQFINTERVTNFCALGFKSTPKTNRSSFRAKTPRLSTINRSNDHGFLSNRIKTLPGISQNLKKNHFSLTRKNCTQEENIKKWNRMISDNPSVQEFRNVITKQNEELVYRKRMLVLEKGARFPKLPQKVVLRKLYALLDAS